MAQAQDTFRRALLTILGEVFDGPPGRVAFLLNPGDPGLRHVEARTEWDDATAGGALASAAHTAYYVGAIRQTLAAHGVAPAA